MDGTAIQRLTHFTSKTVVFTDYGMPVRVLREQSNHCLETLIPGAANLCIFSVCETYPASSSSNAAFIIVSSSASNAKSEARYCSATCSAGRPSAPASARSASSVSGGKSMVRVMFLLYLVCRLQPDRSRAELAELCIVVCDLQYQL